MIKIVKAKYLDGYRIRLFFSDGSVADYDFSELLRKKSSLTKDLEDLEYFKNFLIDLGAIGWKNGLELSPWSLYEKARERGWLQSIKDVA